MEVINDYIDGKLFGYPFRKQYEWRTDLVGFDSGIEQRNQLWTLPIRHWHLPYRFLNESQMGKVFSLFNRAKGQYDTFLLEDPKEFEETCSFTQAKIEIDTATALTKTFEVTGNYIDHFKDGVHFAIASSGDNDGDYTCNGDSTISADKTLIIVDQAVTDADPENGHILKKEFQLFATYCSGKTEEWTENRKDIQPGEISVVVNSIPKTETTHYTLDDATGIIIFTDENAPADTLIIAATFKYYFRVRFSVNIFGIDTISKDLYNPEDIELIQIKNA